MYLCICSYNRSVNPGIIKQITISFTSTYKYIPIRTVSIYFSDVGEIWYKISAHNAVLHLWVSWNSAPKWNYICTCTVKHYDILEIKNAFAKSVYCVTDYMVKNRLTYWKAVCPKLLLFKSSLEIRYQMRGTRCRPIHLVLIFLLRFYFGSESSHS